MKAAPPLSPTDVLAAAASAAQQAAAAAEAAYKAVQALQPDSAPATANRAPANCQPFAEISLPGLPGEASRRQPSHIKWHRIHFHCPACRRFTVLPMAHCGTLVSCPKCYTGIRVPDPRRKIPALNLGRTLAPLLRPESFSHCVDARRFIPWLTGRLPSQGQVVAAIGVVLLLTGISGLTPVSLAWARQERAIASPAPAPSPQAGRNLAEEAEQTVQRFLAAGSPEEKAAWVIDPQNVLPLMVQWYSRKPADGAAAGASIGSSSQGYYASPGTSVTVSEVPVTRPGSATRTYVVEHRAEGPRIAWPESVGFSPVSWQELVDQTPVRKAPVRMRLLACQDDYWNYTFNAENLHHCVRLHDPETLEQLGFGYLPRTSGMAESIASSLPAGGGGLLYPVTLTVLPHHDSARTRQVTLTTPIEPGWGTPAPSAGQPLNLATSLAN